MQLNTDVVASLEETLPTECEEYIDPEYFLKSKDEIQQDKIYLAKYEPDIWSRVQILNVLSDSEVFIFNILNNYPLCQFRFYFTNIVFIYFKYKCRLK